MRLADVLDPEALTRECAGVFAGDLDRWVDAGRAFHGRDRPESTRLRAFFVPGRIEICGKHTDYAGGRSLVAATERGFHVLVAPRSDRELHLLAPPSSEEIVVDPARELPRPDHWSAYPLAVAARMSRDFGLTLRGVDILYSSDLPAAAGLSSSSALIVATWLALAAHNPVEREPVYRSEIEDRQGLAAYLAAVESGRSFGGLPSGRGVGTRGGSEDHTAILCSASGRLTRYSYLPTRSEQILDLPRELTFVVASSGVRAEKAGGARARYNRVSDLAGALAHGWRQETGGNAPHLASILARGAPARRRARAVAERLDRAAHGGDHVRRLEHFVAESEEIVPAASRALAAGDLRSFGGVIDRSQRLAERLLGNQVEETSHLAKSARRLGAHGASSFGAGFGGAVWALVDAADVETFMKRWRDDFLSRLPRRRDRAEFLATGPGPGALELGRG